MFRPSNSSSKLVADLDRRICSTIFQLWFACVSIIIRRSVSVRDLPQLFGPTNTVTLSSSTSLPDFVMNRDSFMFELNLAG